MKKYNTVNFKWLLLWIITPILLFFIAMGSVYAYFTATARRQEADLTTAIIRVGFSDSTATNIVDANSVVSTNILPGSTINVSGAVQNIGTMPLYAILEFIVTIDGEASPVEHAYFTATGADLVYSNGNYTAATQISVGTGSNFQISYNFDFDQYDNTYMGRAVQVELIAHAIQVENIASAVEASNIMMEAINS